MKNPLKIIFYPALERRVPHNEGTRQISDIIEDIYGFELSESMVTAVTNKIIPQIEESGSKDRFSGTPNNFH